MTIDFVVRGLPAPQGSKSFMGMRNGRAILAESSKAVAPWRKVVKHAAVLAGDGHNIPLVGPVELILIFTMRRPRRPQFEFPAVQPDLSKLIRSTEDAITDAGLWKSDGQVVISKAFKVYPGNRLILGMLPLEEPGCRIMISEVDPETLFI